MRGGLPDWPGYPERYLELLAARGERATVVNGAVFRRYANIVDPVGPAEADYTLSADEAATALARLGGVLVRTTAGFGSAPVRSHWYAVVCRTFRDVGEVPSSNARSKLRRGLRNCEVRRLTIDEICDAGYEVYLRAQERYGEGSADARAEFEAHARAAEGFGDIVEYWGAFCDGTLAGFSHNYLLGDTEVAYSTIRFHPAYLKRYVSYALFHRMNQEYLAERGFRYANVGFRSILHDTRVQDFLEHDFGFEKAYMRLDLHYRAPLGALVKATFPLRRFIGRFDQRLRAVYELERSARSAR